MPFLRFGNGFADPKDQQRGKNPDEKQIAWRLIRQNQIGDHSHEDSDVHTALQDGRNPWPPPLWPGFRKQRRPDRPFAADAQRRKKSEDEKMPPALRKKGKSREQRVSE